MDRPTKLIEIVVYIVTPDGNNSIEILPHTGQFLTGIQVIPGIGDWITIRPEDWPLLGVEPDKPDHRCIVEVKRRILDAGVVVECHFSSQQSQPLGWQRIPLN